MKKMDTTLRTLLESINQSQFLKRYAPKWMPLTEAFNEKQGNNLLSKEAGQLMTEVSEDLMMAPISAHIIVVLRESGTILLALDYD